MKKINLDEIMENINFENDFLTRCSNGLYLTNYEISVLEKYNINYNKTTSLKEIIYLIENILNEESYEDLENISMSISERDYYINSNK